VSCVPRSGNCISCVPRCLLHAYQLRPQLSTADMTSCFPRLVRNCVSCIERCECTKCPTIGRFLHSFIVFYCIHNYMHTYRIVEWYRQHRCYITVQSLSPIKKYFLGKRQTHYVPNIANCKLFLRSDENTVCGKCFNAVSLAVPSIRPPNCAYIILIYSAESAVWQFINVLLFHVQTLLSWFTKMLDNYTGQQNLTFFWHTRKNI